LALLAGHPKPYPVERTAIPANITRGTEQIVIDLFRYINALPCDSSCVSSHYLFDTVYDEYVEGEHGAGFAGGSEPWEVGAMEKAKTANRYSAQVRSRAVRMVLEHGADHASQWAAIGSIAAKIGCTPENTCAAGSWPGRA
jgi:hypothetical protein